MDLVAFKNPLFNENSPYSFVFWKYSLQNNSDHKAVINKDPEQGQTSSWTLLVNYQGSFTKY